MSEQELREGLQAAVVDEPALAFDPDTLMARAQREIKRRRALFGAGLATVAVAVAAVAVPTMLGSPRPGATAGGPGWAATDCASASAAMPSDLPIRPGQPDVIYMPEAPGSGTDVTVPPSGTPTEPSGTPTAPKTPPSPEPTKAPEPSAPPEPCPPSGEPSGPPTPPPSASGSAAPDQPQVYFYWPPAEISKRTYTAAELRKHGEAMREHLKETFAKLVPGATDVTVDEFGGEASSAVSDGQGYLDSFVHFSANKARTAVDVAVFAPGQGSPPDVVCGQGTCTTQDGPDGTKLLTTKIAVGRDGKATIVTVSHYRADGSVVMISGYNYDPSSQTGFEVLPAMPVDHEQLVALATDPQLGL